MSDSPKSYRPPNECPKCGKHGRQKQNVVLKDRIKRYRYCTCGEEWNTAEIYEDYYKHMRKYWMFVVKVFNEIHS